MYGFILYQSVIFRKDRIREDKVQILIDEQHLQANDVYIVKQDWENRDIDNMDLH